MMGLEVKIEVWAQSSRMQDKNTVWAPRDL